MSHIRLTFGQRLRASDGALLGSNFVISAELGPEGPGGVAYDSDMNRYLVVYEGGPVGAVHQRVRDAGRIQDSRRKRLLRGWGHFVTWDPRKKEYLVTWAPAPRSELRQADLPDRCFVGETFETNGDEIGIGNWNPMSVYNPASNEFLIYWFNSYNTSTSAATSPSHFPPRTTSPGPVTGFTATPGPSLLTLNWNSPSDSDYAGVIIRCRNDTYPKRQRRRFWPSNRGIPAQPRVSCTPTSTGPRRTPTRSAPMTKQ